MTARDAARRWGVPAALVALPCVLLLLDSDWIYPGSRRDPWLYFGYFRSLRLLVSTAPDAYWASRLSVLLPGWLLHAILPTLAANALLHVGLHATAVLSFFGVARRWSGPRAATLAAVALGSHPFFLVAMGRDHPDAFGIAYLLLALFLLVRATEPGARWRASLLGAGAAVTALVSANVFYATYVPFLLLAYLVTNARGARRPAPTAAFWSAAGGGALFAAFCVVSRALGGHAFYLRSSFAFLAGAMPKENPFRHAAAEWMPRAGWLVVPAVVAGASLVLLARGRRKDAPGAPLPLPAALCAGYALLLLAVQAAHDPVLEYPFYASLLLPFTYLVLAAFLAPPLDALSPRAAAIAGGLAAALLVLPAGFFLQPAALEALRGLEVPLLVPVLAAVAALVALAALRPRPAVAVPLFAVLFSASQFAASELAGLDREFAAIGSDRRGVFLQVARARDAIAREVPDGRFYLWFDAHERLGGVYDTLSTTQLLCPRLVNMDLPHLAAPIACDGTPLVPGTEVVVAAEDLARVADAAEALAAQGLTFRRAATETVPGSAGPSFVLAFGRLEAR